MQGYLSTDGNGMRFALRSALVNAGHGVNMVGSVRAGTMGNNETETWGGFRIEEVAAKAELSIPKMPNVALILCGSNDITQNYDTANMAQRMGVLIDRLFAAIPGVVVIVSTLPPRGDATSDATTVVFNANVTYLVNTYQRAGKLARIVDTHNQWFTTADLNADGLHLTDAGYVKLARVFYDGIMETIATISAPIDTGISVSFE
jgi:lysophospholipase L1-like esterase